MGTLLIVSVLFGMLLGLFFKWPILVPACGLVVILVLASPAPIERSHLGLLLEIIAVTACLQTGYVAGIFSRYVNRAEKRSMQPGDRKPDRAPSTPAQSRKGGRKAA